MSAAHALASIGCFGRGSSLAKPLATFSTCLSRVWAFPWIRKLIIFACSTDAASLTRLNASTSRCLNYWRICKLMCVYFRIYTFGNFTTTIMMMTFVRISKCTYSFLRIYVCFENKFCAPCSSLIGFSLPFSFFFFLLKKLFICNLRTQCLWHHIRMLFSTESKSPSPSPCTKTFEFESHTHLIV